MAGVRFADFDLNADGIITRDEFRSAMGCPAVAAADAMPSMGAFAASRGQMHWEADGYLMDSSLNGLRDAIGEEAFRRLMHSEVQLEMARAGVFSSPGGVLPVGARSISKIPSHYQRMQGSPPGPPWPYQSPLSIPWAQPIDINMDGQISSNEVALAESERRLELVRSGLQPPDRSPSTDMLWAARPYPENTRQEMNSLKEWSPFRSKPDGGTPYYTIPTKPPPLPPPLGPPPPIGLTSSMSSSSRATSPLGSRYLSSFVPSEPIIPAGISGGGPDSLGRSVRSRSPTPTSAYPPVSDYDRLAWSQGWRPSSLVGHPADINRDGIVDAHEAGLAASEVRLRRVQLGLDPDTGNAEPRIAAPATCSASKTGAWPPPLFADINRDGVIDSKEMALAESELALQRVRRDGAAVRNMPGPERWQRELRPADAGYPRGRSTSPVWREQLLGQRPVAVSTPDGRPVDINRDGFIDAREAALAESERRLREVQVESAFLASKAIGLPDRRAWAPSPQCRS